MRNTGTIRIHSGGRSFWSITLKTAWMLKVWGGTAVSCSKVTLEALAISAEFNVQVWSYLNCDGQDVKSLFFIVEFFNDPQFAHLGSIGDGIVWSFHLKMVAAGRQLQHFKCFDDHQSLNYANQYLNCVQKPGVVPSISISGHESGIDNTQFVLQIESVNELTKKKSEKSEKNPKNPRIFRGFKIRKKSF